MAGYGAYAKVDLSSNYRSLSGVALTLADYAITLTLTQLPQIAIVSITVRGQDLAYRDTQTFTARDVLLSSNEDVIGTVPATLYFLDEVPFKDVVIYRRSGRWTCTRVTPRSAPWRGLWNSDRRTGLCAWSSRRSSR